MAANQIHCPLPDHRAEKEKRKQNACAFLFLIQLRADGLVIDGARAAVSGDELVAERVDQTLIAVDGHDVLARREDHEPFGESAHPLFALHGAADVGGDGRDIAPRRSRGTRRR